jgi:glycosyltransferase involved in cell wall biosynthesis
LECILHKVLIISKDLKGPVRNGGVGAAFFEQAKVLSKEGYEVECLLTCPIEYIEGESNYWKKKYLNLGIKLTILDEVFDPLLLKNHEFHTEMQRNAYRNYQYVKTNPKDLVIYSEFGADGFYISKYKPNNCKTLCFLHGTSYWGKQENAEFIDFKDLVDFDFEFASINQSTNIVATSKYIHYYYKDYIKKNVSYVCNPLADTEFIYGYKPIKTICFFSRLEFRKGIDLFLGAAEIIRHTYPNIEINIIGKGGVFNGKSSFKYLQNKLSKFENKVNLYTELDTEEAIKLIKEKEGLVIFPSRADNCPLTILECIANQLPVIIAEGSGTEELIEKKEDYVFKPYAGDMAELAIKHLKTKKFKLTLPSVFVKNSLKDYVDVVRKTINHTGEVDNIKVENDSHRCISVCIPTILKKNENLKKVLEIISKSEFVKEIIIVIDGSKQNQEEIKFFAKKLSKKIKFKFYYQPNRFPGAARNLAAKEATGNYLLFIDDDNLPKDNMIEEYYKVIVNDIRVDLVSSWFKVISTDIKYIQVMSGISGLSDIVNNKISDNNILIKRKLFIEIGGYPERWGVGYEDFNMLKKIDSGKIYIIDKPLFDYFKSTTGVNNGTSLLAGFYSVGKDYAGYTFKTNDPLMSLIASRSYLQQPVEKDLFRSYPTILSYLESPLASDDYDSLFLLAFSRDKGITSKTQVFDKLLLKLLFNQKANKDFLLRKYLSTVKSWAENQQTYFTSAMTLLMFYLGAKGLSPLTLKGLDDKDILVNIIKLINLLIMDGKVDAKKPYSKIFVEGEKFYIAEYSDIGSAVKEGYFKSGLEHYFKVFLTESWRDYRYASILFMGNKIINA